MTFSPRDFHRGLFSRALSFIGLAVATASILGCSDPDSPNIPASQRKLTDGQRARAMSHVLDALPAEGVTFPADVALQGGAVRYLGTAIRTGARLSNAHGPGQAVTVRRGDRVRLVHYFRRDGKVEGNWKLFVHGDEGPKSRMAVNADHHPLMGLLPLARWPEGKVVEDVHEVTIPESAPDRLRLWVGFYRLNDRMKVVGRLGQDGHDRLEAGVLSIQDSRPLPVYTAHRRKGDIALDGKLDDEGWKGVASTGAFGRSLDGKKPHSRTEAWMTWDDEAIYVAFDMDDEDVWGTFRNRDDAIYDQEVVEVFLDADGNGKTYNELELSPHQVVFDAYFPARRRGMDKSWDSGMESGVSVRGTLDDGSDRDEGWTAELRIPVKNLADVPRWPPAPGDRWRFNLYRLDWHSGRKKNEGQAFSPLFVGDFHHLPRFGILEFAE